MLIWINIDNLALDLELLVGLTGREDTLIAHLIWHGQYTLSIGRIVLELTLVDVASLFDSELSLAFSLTVDEVSDIHITLFCDLSDIAVRLVILPATIEGDSTTLHGQFALPVALARNEVAGVRVTISVDKGTFTVWESILERTFI